MISRFVIFTAIHIKMGLVVISWFYQISAFALRTFDSDGSLGSRFMLWYSNNGCIIICTFVILFNNHIVGDWTRVLDLSTKIPRSGI